MAIAVEVPPSISVPKSAQHYLSALFSGSPVSLPNSLIDSPGIECSRILSLALRDPTKNFSNGAVDISGERASNSEIVSIGMSFPTCKVEMIVFPQVATELTPNLLANSFMSGTPLPPCLLKDSDGKFAVASGKIIEIAVVDNNPDRVAVFLLGREPDQPLFCDINRCVFI